MNNQVDEALWRLNKLRSDDEEKFSCFRELLKWECCNSCEVWASSEEVSLMEENVAARTYESGTVPNVSGTVQDHLLTVLGLKAKLHTENSHIYKLYIYDKTTD